MKNKPLRTARPSRHYYLLFAAAAAVPSVASALAPTYDWIVNTSDWNTPGNWSLDAVPTDQSYVSITQVDAVNRTISYDYPGPSATFLDVYLSNSGGGTETLSMSNIRETLSADTENVGGFFASTLEGGATGAGAIIQSNSINSVGDLEMGYNPIDAGSYNLSASGLLIVSTTENVGRSGTGTFVQSGGVNELNTQNSSFSIAANASSTGTYTQSGGTLELTVQNISENVGLSGNGIYNQSGGVNSLFVNSLNLGYNAGATGTYNLSNTGTLIGGGENVGYSGTGIFNQSGGLNTIFGSSMYLGYNANSTGTYILSGTGTLMIEDAGEYVGFGGTGTFLQSGGINSLNSAALIVGGSGSGSYTLTNSGSLYVGGELDIGDGGSGTFIQSGTSTNTVTTNLDMGAGSSGVASYTLSGSASLTVQDTEYVGQYGSGTFNQSGGNHNITGTASLYVAYGEGSTGNYILSGGTLALATGSEYIGYDNEGVFYATGTFNQSGGLNSVGGEIDLGGIAGGTGAYILSGTGSISAGSEIVGDASVGLFNQSGGTNSCAAVELGNRAGSSGTYILSGGVLTDLLTNDTVGYLGTGLFNQSGGTHASHGFALGLNGGTGTYILSGTATLTASDAEQVGYAGLGFFNQTGGSNAVTLDGLQIGDITGATGTYTLVAGSLSSSGGEFVGDGGVGFFNQTGGTNQLTANQLDIGNETTGGSTGTYVLSGTGTLIAPNVYVGGSNFGAGGQGVLTVSGSASTSISGILNVWGGGRVNLDVPITSIGRLLIVGKGIVNLNGTLNINFIMPANDPVVTIAGYLKTGYNGGAWTGTSGIISTSAQTLGSPALSVGYADGNTDSGTTAGLNQIVVKYTLAGDTNLDGLVNFADLVAVLQNFNKGNTDWAHGNFAYGASTNFGDLVAVLQNYNKTLPPPSGSAVTLGGTIIPLVSATDVPLPEPGALALAAAGMVGLLKRRRSSGA